MKFIKRSFAVVCLVLSIACGYVAIRSMSTRASVELDWRIPNPAVTAGKQSKTLQVAADSGRFTLHSSIYWSEDPRATESMKLGHHVGVDMHTPAVGFVEDLSTPGRHLHALGATLYWGQVPFEASLPFPDDRQRQEALEGVSNKAHAVEEQGGDLHLALIQAGEGVLYAKAWQRITFVSVPAWMLVLAFAIPPIIASRAWWPWVRRRRRRRAGLCASCGYDLRASATECPECGSVRLV